MSLNYNTELALINTTTNSGTVTLPSAITVPGRVISFKDSAGNFLSNNFTLICDGSDTFEDGTTQKVFNESFGSIQVVASGTKWYILSGVKQNMMTISSLIVSSISAAKLLSGIDIITPAISTTTISTSILNTNSINAPVNINVGKSLIPFSGNNLDLGNAGAFRWRNLWVSTISSIHTQSSTITATNTITASTIAIDRIRGATSDTNIFTQNLFPLGSGSQLGYNSGGTAGGGFYNILAARSTFTQVINPSGEAGRFSNAVYINTNLSTQNIQVSTINRKLYPYTSTFGILNSASTFTFSGTTSVVPQVLYSNITFPHVGTYLVSGKNTISKSAGGAGQEPYGYFSLSRGLYPSTFNIQDGFNSVPYLNHQNISTFNTFTSEIYVSSMNTNTRFITYADQSGHNYTINFGLGQLRATYIPSQGLNPE